MLLRQQLRSRSSGCDSGVGHGWLLNLPLMLLLIGWGAGVEVWVPVARAGEDAEVTSPEAARPESSHGPAGLREVGSRREVFAEPSVLERLEGGARLELHSPVPREVVLVHDAPWEGNATAYHQLFREGEWFRMYYQAGHLEVRDGQLLPRAPSACYAESRDGIHWTKPGLGLHSFGGSTANNIVITEEQAQRWKCGVGGPALFLDRNPAVAPEARYKGFVTCRDPLGMLPIRSADGLHWEPMVAEPVIRDGAFDSLNLAFWDDVRKEYRAYWRYFTGGVTTSREWKPAGVRAIRTAVSRDFLTWEHQTDLKFGEGPEVELYENGVWPYHRAPQLLLGLPVRYVDRANAPSVSDAQGGDRATPQKLAGWSPSLRSLPELAQRRDRAAISERFGTALTEGLLMASRDGTHFHRWDEAFLRPGPERPGTWNYGQQFIAWQPIETASELPGGPPELSLYATEGYWTTSAVRLRRYTLRLDGFVSLRGNARGGEAVTVPLRYTGRQLRLNLATSAAGGVRVELQSPAGEPLPGWTFADCDELFGDTLDRAVTWRGEADLTRWSGQPVRLRFRLRDADLYAWQFVP